MVSAPMARSRNAPTDAQAVTALPAASPRAVDAVCDRWSLTVAIAILQGHHRFNDLLAATGLSTRLLTARLRAMEADGIVVRTPYSTRPPRFEYHLSAKGAGWSDIILQMARWEQDWAGMDVAAHRLTHRPCGAPLRPQLRCQTCNSPTGPADIEPFAERPRTGPSASQAWSRRASSGGEAFGEASQFLGPSLEVMGDRSSVRVLLGVFAGVTGFNDIRAFTGMASNQIADRLDKLLAAGLLARGLDAKGRPGYRLTGKGLDLWGVLVVIETWADAWLPASGDQAPRPVHLPGAHTFRPKTVCASCCEAIAPVDVVFPPSRRGLAAAGDGPEPA